MSNEHKPDAGKIADAMLAKSREFLTGSDSNFTDEQIDALWLYRKDLHNGEIMPQLRAFARALLSASKPAALSFEAWAKQEGLISESHGAHFVNSMCDVAQKAWNAALAASPAAPSADAQDESAAFTDQQIYDEFSFLEGLVSEVTYRNISDKAIEIARAALQSPSHPTDAAAPAQAGEPVAWRDAIKSYPSPDMTLAPQSSQPVEAGERRQSFDLPPTPKADAMVMRLPHFNEFALKAYAVAAISLNASRARTAPSAVALDDERAADNEPAAYLVRGLDGYNEEYASVWIKRANADAAAAAIFRASITPLVQARAASPQATATQPAQTDDARDAARYRFARDNILPYHDLPGAFCLGDSGETWDKTIDASMAAAQPASGADHE